MNSRPGILFSRRGTAVLLAAGAVLAAAGLSGCGGAAVTSADAASLSGLYGLDSIGHKRPPVLVSSSNGVSAYVTAISLSFDPSTTSYLGTEVDSTLGLAPRADVVSTTLAGGYRVVGDSVALSGIGLGTLTSNGFQISTTPSGTYYFSKR